MRLIILIFILILVMALVGCSTSPKACVGGETVVCTITNVSGQLAKLTFDNTTMDQAQRDTEFIIHKLVLHGFISTEVSSTCVGGY